MIMKAVLPEIKERLPNSVIIWSHILQRKHYLIWKEKNVNVELIIQLQLLF